MARKRFRIKYFSDLEVSNIDLRFIYPDFSRFTELSCPSFAIRDQAIFDINNYFGNKRIFSYWHRARDIHEIYAEAFRLFSILIGLIKFYVIVVRPFQKSEKAQKKMAFWLVYPIWFLELNSMIGFLGTNFRGVLGQYLEAQSSLICTGWLGISDGGRWLARDIQKPDIYPSVLFSMAQPSDDVFLGKFTQYRTSPLFLYQSLIQFSIYMTLFFGSLATTKKVKSTLIQIRVGFVYCFMVQFLLFGTLSIRLFFQSAIRSQFIVWGSAAASAVCLSCVLLELFGIYFNRDSEINSLKNSKNLIFAVI